MNLDWLDKLLFSARGNHVLLAISFSLLMSAVWAGVARLFGSDHTLVVALIVFLVMFGVLVRGAGDVDN